MAATGRQQGANLARGRSAPVASWVALVLAFALIRAPRTGQAVAAGLPSSPAGATSADVVAGRPGASTDGRAKPASPTILAETWCDQPTELGFWLLGELNCVACHAAPEPVRQRLTVRPAPDLRVLGGWRTPGHVARYLDTPQRVRPGTTMPDLFHGLEPGERGGRIAALAALIEAARRSASPDVRVSSALRVAQGRVLYHQVGCIACHPAFDPAAVALGSSAANGWHGEEAAPAVIEGVWPAVDLGWVGDAWTEQGLAAFLEQPERLRADSRMPSLGLTADEARAIAAYLLRQTRHVEGARGKPPAPQAAGLIAAGRRWFAGMNCAACHPGLVEGTNVPAPEPARPLPALHPGSATGCLAENPPPGRPAYALSARQRRALVLALESMAPNAGPPTPAEALHRWLATFNCFACHVRGERGGPWPAQAGFFRSRSAGDLGDEGRFPPRLDQAGAKLRPEWLARVLQERLRPRPYLSIRMPVWSAERAAQLTSVFGEVDRNGAEASEPPMTGLDPATGARLLGPEGCGCVTCHRLDGRPGWTLSAMDLAWTTRRLEWSWFRRYLEDPSALRPGTRMPSFWPGGRAALADVLGGDARAQISAVWRYLETRPDPDPD